MRSLRLLIVAITAALLLGACGDDDDETGSTATSEAANETPIEGTVTVFAAASLTDAFEDVGDAFEQANPDANVEFNFAASSALREQILAGAPADVFASANPSNMDQVVEEGAAADPTDFVENELQIAVPPGNDAGVTGLEDFGNDDLLIGLCAEEVPCGEFGREALANAGVTPRSTPTSPTCVRCSPRSKPASSTPASCTAPTCLRLVTPSRA